MISYVLFTLLAVLQLADIWSTRKILLAGGREQNPIMARAFKAFGMMPVLIGKAALVLALGWFVLLPYPWILAALYVFYGWIVWHNWRSL